MLSGRKIVIFRRPGRSSPSPGTPSRMCTFGRSSNPGTNPKSRKGFRQAQPDPKFKGMLAVRKLKQTPQSRKQTNAPDGCSTDPESNIELAKGQLSNMRSKCRCSCVLQFTFRRAVSCVLHRPPSQVIHCTVLCFKHCSASALAVRILNS